MTSITKIFSSRSEKDDKFYHGVKKILTFKPGDITIYQEAFTHRSMNTTNTEGSPQNYERLEFLGDAVLGSVIAAHLFKKVP